MNKFKKKYNQIWKDMGFITDGDNFAVNVFRGIFWITVIWTITFILAWLFVKFAWHLDYLYPGIWK